MITSSSDGGSNDVWELPHHQSYVDLGEDEFRAVTGFFGGISESLLGTSNPGNRIDDFIGS